MNAVLSADTLAWRTSAAFDSNLVVGDVEPADVYEFVGRSTFDAEFRKNVLADTRNVLARFRLPTAGEIRAPGLVEDRMNLAPEELNALDELSREVHGHGLEGVRAAERGALREGHGLPAVAALVVLVVVAVAVYVFLVSVRQP